MGKHTHSVLSPNMITDFIFQPW